ncbi:MAG: nucleoside-diphosphate kinase [Candidatus Lokiarchaeota archaeon]|nr:nucleoside-diphosphate kinase [Candidatus Lokiarchaeota archaeon]
MDKTFVMIKPDAVRRNLIGKIITRFEEAGFKLINLKLITLSRELASKHYAEHKGKPFYNDLLAFITSGPSIAMLLQGEDVIKKVRKIVGATNPEEAQSGTIRGDFKEIPLKSVTENLIHASDSESSAKREIYLFFENNLE